jgi:hypothetical protein
MAIANYFYNETTRRYVALFGTLFNQIKIERSSNDGTNVQSMIVPLSYAPAQKVLSRLRDDPDLLNSRKTAITLPRMSFEITSLNYDPQRKIGSTQKMVKSTKSETDASRNFVHSAVPYNVEFSLYIMTKYSEDATKILEQIIPFFTPDWTVTAKMVNDLDPIDIPVVLNSVTTEDLYEGDYESRQTVLYTLTFTLKGWYFGPEKKQKVIKFIDIDMMTDTASNSPRQEGVTIKPGLDSNGNPLTEDGVGATATAVLDNGTVGGVIITNDGENYNANNDISISIAAPDPLDADISLVITNTSISSIAINEAGGFYSSPPNISISPPDLPATTAEATQVLTDGVITAINVSNSGTYYSSGTITISEPPAKSPYVKFGDDALYHDDHADTTFLHTTGINIVTAGSGFEIDFWIYPTEFNATDSHVIHFPGTTMRIELEADGEAVYRPNFNSAPTRSNEQLILNQWNHCRIEHVGATARWCVNGVSDAGSSAPQGFILAGGATINAGSRSGSEKSFLGALDNITLSVRSTLTPAGSYTVPTSPTSGDDYTGNFDKDLASADLVIAEGEVTSVTLTNGGANYDANTVITISDPDGTPSTFQASATAVLVDGGVDSVLINNNGKFYSTANATIDSVVSSQATAEVTIDGTDQVSSINITNAGSGYRTTPAVTIGGPAATSVPYTQIEFDDDWGIITILEDE